MDKGLFCLTFVGMMLYWPFLRRNVLFYSLAGHDATMAQSASWLMVCLAVECVTMVVVRVREGSGRAPLRGRGATRALLAASAVQAALKCLELIASPAGVAGVMAALLDVVLFALVFTGLTYAWARRCVETEARLGAVAALASFAASFLVVNLSFASGAAGSVLMACVPLVSAVCWAASEPAARRMVARAHARAASAVAPAGPTEAPATSSAGSSVGAPATFSAPARALDVPGPVASRGAIMLLAAFLVASGALRGFLPSELSGTILGADGWRDLMTVACTVLLFGCYLLAPSRVRRFRGAWAVGTVVIFAGLLIMTGFGADQLYTGQQVVITGRTCLDVFFWVVLADDERARRAAGVCGVHHFAWLFVLVDAVTAALGYVLIPLFRDALGLSVEGSFASLATIVTFALVAVLVVSFVGVMPRADGAADADATRPGGADDARAPSAPAGPEGWRAAWVAELRDTYALTEREAQVALLLAEGNSQKRVSEELGISLGTAQSHIRGAYRKLGIHSRQELVDLAHGAQVPAGCVLRG